jgi:hypothetical protein
LGVFEAALSPSSALRETDPRISLSLNPGYLLAAIRATRRPNVLEAVMKRFSLPPGMGPDPHPPRSIVHGCDYMLRDDGAFEFHYSYLDYYWTIDGRDIRARHYLDRPGPAKVALMLAFAQYDEAKHAGMLAYLQRRYYVIETFEQEGYVARWMLQARK